MTSIYDLKMVGITGESVDFGQFRGQALLVVNVASACGLTPQYTGLNELHNQFDDLTVLGFPCNQFAQQEPGSEAEIAEFCKLNYGVDFPLFAKVDVNGASEAPLYSMLKAAQPGEGDTGDITWNFEKFLVDQAGTVVARFSPATNPAQVAEAIPGLLKS